MQRGAVMDDGARFPILVTGSHRSGSTWVGRMLCLSAEASYVDEPFNVNLYPHWPRRHFPHWFQYVCDENEADYLSVVREIVDLRYPLWPQATEMRSFRQVALLGRNWARSRIETRRQPCALLKDPLAVFSAEWLARRFGARPLVMIRHPAGFVGSIKRLDWQFDFSNWSDQPLLMRDYLAPFESAIERYAVNPPDIIDQAILMWRVIYSVVHDLQTRHPEWLFARLEDLDREPVPGFRDLYHQLGLRFDDAVRTGVEGHSQPGNPEEVPADDFRSIHRDSRAAAHQWRTRLTADEVTRVRRSLEEESAWYYGSDAWPPE